MIKDLKFPWLYVIEFGLWLPLMLGFYMSVSFLAAAPIAGLELHGKSLPLTWEAAVPSHGRFLRGYIISNHPTAFAFGIVLLAGSAVAIYPVRKAQAVQSKVSGPGIAGKHKAANISVMAALAAVSYFVISHVFVGVVPA
jgi:hypothetical protein